jgi:hypothetical protein
MPVYRAKSARCEARPRWQPVMRSRTPRCGIICGNPRDGARMPDILALLFAVAFLAVALILTRWMR